MGDEEEAVHDDNVRFYVLYLENVRLTAPNPQGLQACIHWYIGDVDYSSVPFVFPPNQSSYQLKNCGFIVVPNSALSANDEDNQLTLSITSWEGEHLGVFFGNPAEIATRETFDRHELELLTEDGVFAKVELHAACQGRWTMGPANENIFTFVDPQGDAQAKHIWDFIAAGNDQWKGDPNASPRSSARQSPRQDPQPIEQEQPKEEPKEAEPESAKEEPTKAETEPAKEEPKKEERAVEPVSQDLASQEPASRTSAQEVVSGVSFDTEENQPVGDFPVAEASGDSPKQRRTTRKSMKGGESRKMKSRKSMKSDEDDKDFDSFMKSSKRQQSLNASVSKSKSTKSKSMKSQSMKSQGLKKSCNKRKDGVEDFLLDNHVDQLNEFTNGIYGEEGISMQLMSPQTGARVDVRVRIVTNMGHAFMEVRKRAASDRNSREEPQVTTIKLSEVRNMFMGQRMDDRTKQILDLHDQCHGDGGEFLTDSCLTVQISDSLSFLTFAFITREETLESDAAYEKVGNRIEYMPEFIEIFRSYYNDSKTTDDRMPLDEDRISSDTKMNLLRGGKAAIRNLCQEAQSSAEKAVAQKGRPKAMPKSKGDGAASVGFSGLGGGGTQFGARSDADEADFQTPRTAYGASSLGDMRKSESAIPPEKLQRMLDKLLAGLEAMSKQSLPEACRQFMVLQLKKMPVNAQFVSAHVIDDWCFEFFSHTKHEISELQIQLNAHLHQQSILELPMSIPDQAKLFLAHVLQSEVDADARAFLNNAEVNNGLHIPEVGFQNVLAGTRTNPLRGLGPNTTTSGEAMMRMQVGGGSGGAGVSGFAGTVGKDLGVTPGDAAVGITAVGTTADASDRDKMRHVAVTAGMLDMERHLLNHLDGPESKLNVGILPGMLTHVKTVLKHVEPGTDGDEKWQRNVTTANAQRMLQNMEAKVQDSLQTGDVDAAIVAGLLQDVRRIKQSTDPDKTTQSFLLEQEQTHNINAPVHAGNAMLSDGILTAQCSLLHHVTAPQGKINAGITATMLAKAKTRLHHSCAQVDTAEELASRMKALESNCVLILRAPEPKQEQGIRELLPKIQDTLVFADPDRSIMGNLHGTGSQNEYHESALKQVIAALMECQDSLLGYLNKKQTSTQSLIVLSGVLREIRSVLRHAEVERSMDSAIVCESVESTEQQVSLHTEVGHELGRDITNMLMTFDRTLLHHVKAPDGAVDLSVFPELLNTCKQMLKQVDPEKNATANMLSNGSERDYHASHAKNITAALLNCQKEILHHIESPHERPDGAVLARMMKETRACLHHIDAPRQAVPLDTASSKYGERVDTDQIRANNKLFVSLNEPQRAAEITNVIIGLEKNLMHLVDSQTENHDSTVLPDVLNKVHSLLELADPREEVTAGLQNVDSGWDPEALPNDPETCITASCLRLQERGLGYLRDTESDSTQVILADFLREIRRVLHYIQTPDASGKPPGPPPASPGDGEEQNVRQLLRQEIGTGPAGDVLQRALDLEETLLEKLEDADGVRMDPRELEEVEEHVKAMIELVDKSGLLWPELKGQTETFYCDDPVRYILQVLVEIQRCIQEGTVPSSSGAKRSKKPTKTILGQCLKETRSMLHHLNAPRVNNASSRGGTQKFIKNKFHQMMSRPKANKVTHLLLQLERRMLNNSDDHQGMQKAMAEGGAASGLGEERQRRLLQLVTSITEKDVNQLLRKIDPEKNISAEILAAGKEGVYYESAVKHLVSTLLQMQRTGHRFINWPQGQHTVSTVLSDLLKMLRAAMEHSGIPAQSKQVTSVFSRNNTTGKNAHGNRKLLHRALGSGRADKVVKALTALEVDLLRQVQKTNTDSVNIGIFPSLLEQTKRILAIVDPEKKMSESMLHDGTDEMFNADPQRNIIASLLSIQKQSLEHMNRSAYSGNIAVVLTSILKEVCATLQHVEAPSCTENSKSERPLLIHSVGDVKGEKIAEMLLWAERQLLDVCADPNASGSSQVLANFLEHLRVLIKTVDPDERHQKYLQGTADCERLFQRDPEKAVTASLISMRGMIVERLQSIVQEHNTSENSVRRTLSFLLREVRSLIRQVAPRDLIEQHELVSGTAGRQAGQTYGMNLPGGAAGSANAGISSLLWGVNNEQSGTPRNQQRPINQLDTQIASLDQYSYSFNSDRSPIAAMAAQSMRQGGASRRENLSTQQGLQMKITQSPMKSAAQQQPSRFHNDELASRGATQEVATYNVLRSGVNVLAKPVFGHEVEFTGRKLGKGDVIVSDMRVDSDGLRFLRLIDGSGWVVDDSLINPVAPSLLQCGTGAVMNAGRVNMTQNSNNFQSSNNLARKSERTVNIEPGRSLVNTYGSNDVMKTPLQQFQGGTDVLSGSRMTDVGSQGSGFRSIMQNTRPVPVASIGANASPVTRLSPLRGYTGDPEDVDDFVPTLKTPRLNGHSPGTTRGPPGMGGTSMGGGFSNTAFGATNTLNQLNNTGNANDTANMISNKNPIQPQNLSASQGASSNVESMISRDFKGSAYKIDPNHQGVFAAPKHSIFGRNGVPGVVGAEGSMVQRDFGNNF